MEYKTGTNLGLDWCGLGELRTAYECHELLFKPKVSKGYTQFGWGEASDLQKEGDRGSRSVSSFTTAKGVHSSLVPAFSKAKGCLHSIGL